MKKIVCLAVMAASIYAQQPVKLAAGSAIAGKVGIDQTTPGTTNGVTGVGNPAFLAAQQAVTGTAAALATNTIKQACITALSTNAISIFIGGATVTITTGLELKAGTGVCFPLTNTNLVFVVAATTGATVTWGATN